MREPTKEERERAKKQQLNIARKITKDTNEEPMLKTKIIAQFIPFITLGIIIIVIFLLANIMFGGNDNNNVYNEVKTEVGTEVEKENEPIIEEKTELEKETEPITSIINNKIDETSDVSNENIQEVPHREGMCGISNKSINDIDDYFSADNVNNDVTGNWRISTISSDINIVEYALSYYKEKFKNDKEIHGIVNFADNTVTKISKFADTLDIAIHEYTPGEEHDAKMLYGGIVLKQYWVYIDNGDIEEL